MFARKTVCLRLVKLRPGKVEVIVTQVFIKARNIVSRII